MVKIAAAQLDVVFGDVAANLESVRVWSEKAARQNAELVLFPECALTGYVFASKESAVQVAQGEMDRQIEFLAQVCAALGIYIVVGTLEVVEQDLYNVALCVGPQGLISKYRKTHLPHLGVDHFVQAGESPYEVVDLGEVRVGIQICYDISFPEACRCLALLGADLVVVPTNWPPGAEATADYVINARASENKIYVMAANRVGHENGFDFIGKSKICDVHGNTIQFADELQPALLCSDVDPREARDKRIDRAAGHHIDRFADRRPELYEDIARIHELSADHSCENLRSPNHP